MDLIFSVQAPSHYRSPGNEFAKRGNIQDGDKEGLIDVSRMRNDRMNNFLKSST